MKAPFRGWGSGGSRCSETTSFRKGASSRNKKDGKVLIGGAPVTRLVTARTKDSLDTTKESSSSFCEEPSSTPVDMDQFCKEEEDASKISDAGAVMHLSIGVLDEGEEPGERLVLGGTGFDGELSASEETSTFEAAVVTPLHKNDRRMSALTKAMTMKQENLTNDIECLFDDAFTLVTQNQEDQQVTTAGHDEDKALQIIQLKARVAEKLMKQGRVTKQFIDLIRHLEDAAMKKEAINLELQKRLKLANQLLEAEGVDAVESSVVPFTSLTDRRRSSSRNDRHYPSSSARPQRTSPPTSDNMFAITEIFCNQYVQEELDDVSCLLSEVALVAPNTEDQHQPAKKSPPHSPMTDTTVATDDSILVAALQSEKELLEF